MSLWEDFYDGPSCNAHMSIRAHIGVWNNPDRYEGMWTLRIECEGLPPMDNEQLFYPATYEKERVKDIANCIIVEKLYKLAKLVTPLKGE